MGLNADGIAIVPQFLNGLVSTWMIVFSSSLGFLPSEFR